MVLSKHQQIIDDLEDRLNKSKIRYDVIGKNVIYGEGVRVHGEIDLIAIKDNYTLYFEIKTNHTHKAYTKAKDQLTRIKEWFPNHRKNKYFYVCGSGISDKLFIKGMKI